MTRGLLSPRWLLLHSLFVAAIFATGWLAWWQWERAQEAGGSFQNLGYALQWPLFGVFAVFLWYRLVSMHGHARSQGAQLEKRASAQDRSSGGEGRRPLVPPPASPVEASEDPELAAYNRYLASLNETGRSE